jgi:hypothetical protein
MVPRESEAVVKGLSEQMKTALKQIAAGEQFSVSKRQLHALVARGLVVCECEIRTETTYNHIRRSWRTRSSVYTQSIVLTPAGIAAL